MNTDSNIEARLEQIATTARNARTSWFALLALLVFVLVTLMGHDDGDFFSFGAKTQLPLVKIWISVPPILFFMVAPVLTAGLYVYLHIYLHGLWVALSKCPPQIDGDPLQERVYPTMLCTSGVIIRTWTRRDA